ncbi:MAG: hypothetical protein ACKV2T_12530 [Kofleriaceae bacterium]
MILPIANTSRLASLDALFREQPATFVDGRFAALTRFDSPHVGERRVEEAAPGRGATFT